MFKRIITLALAVVCLASFAIVGVSAAAIDAENGVDVKAGDTLSFSVCVSTPDNKFIEDMQGYITYDAEYFQVKEAKSPATAGAIINANEPGIIYFNATDVNTGINLFRVATMNVEFEVLAAADGVDKIATPECVFEEMTERNGDSYFTNSEKVNDAVNVWYEYYNPANEEPTTVVTEPTTVVTEPTTVEPSATAPVVAPETNVTGATETPVTPDIPTTGANVAIFAVLAVVAMAGAAVVVLRKRVNG